MTQEINYIINIGYESSEGGWVILEYTVVSDQATAMALIADAISRGRSIRVDLKRAW